MKNSRALLVTSAAAGCAVGVYLALRPRIHRWGATDAEIYRMWPGDELTPDSLLRQTRAITIQAPAERVWPWIVQIGQDRAGFYSYTVLENLFLAEMRNTYRIVPEWQTRRVGDDFWLAAKHRYGGQAKLSVAEVQPNRALVLVQPRDLASAVKDGYAPHGSWNFILQGLDERRTRLIMRSVAPEARSAWETAAWFAFWDPAHFIMERKMMVTIKRLAESMGQARAAGAGSNL